MCFYLFKIILRFRPPEFVNNNTEVAQSPMTPSSSTSPVSPVVSPQKEQQLLPIRPAPSVPSPVSPQTESRNFVSVSPTTTAVVPAPNNISCNVPNNSVPISSSNVPANGVPVTPTSVNNVPTSASVQSVVSPQAPQRAARRQRASEERRDGSSRRRSGRNRNAPNVPQAAPPQQSNGTNGVVAGSKLDLPPGYGELFFSVSYNYSSQFLV